MYAGKVVWSLRAAAMNPAASSTSATGYSFSGSGEVEAILVGFFELDDDKGIEGDRRGWEWM